MQKFFILFEARSGSSHLVSLLNSSPQITCYAEMYTGQSDRTANRLTRAFLAGEPLHTINEWSLDRHGSVDLGKRPACTGFKTKIYDIPHAKHKLRRLEAAGVTLILLTRQNVLKQAVSREASLQLYQRSGAYNANSSDEAVRQLTVDPAEVIAFAEVYDANQRALHAHYDAWKNPKASFTYEELLADQSKVISQICNLLDLAEFEPRSGVSKNLDDSLRSAIANYDDLAAALDGHPYSRFL